MRLTNPASGTQGDDGEAWRRALRGETTEADIDALEAETLASIAEQEAAAEAEFNGPDR